MRAHQAMTEELREPCTEAVARGTHSREFEMLQAAVSIARSEQIQSVAALRASLLRKFPQESAAIDAALQLWAEYERQRGPRE